MKAFFFIVILLFTLSCKKTVREPASIEGYMRYLPAKYQAALKEYLQMVGLEVYEDDVGQDNAGLVNFNHNLMQQNKCFSQLVGKFYLQVEKVTAEQSKSAEPRENRLFNNLNENRSRSANNGWLWETALEISNNNPNLAMTLIGICGHDDIAQLKEEYETVEDGSVPDLIESQIPVSEEELVLYRNYRRQSLNQFRRALPFGDVMHGEAFEQHAVDSYERGVGCPMPISGFYKPGALGDSTLLNNDLINLVEQAQAPNMGAGHLPSKYYHTMGAAYLGCSLVRNGMPPVMIRKIQNLAIKNYRMMRMCDILSESLNERIETDLMVVSLSKIVDTAMLLKLDASQDGCKSLSEDECFVVSRLREVIIDPDSDREIILSKVRRIVATENARAILSRAEAFQPNKCYERMFGDSKVSMLGRIANNSNNRYERRICKGLSTSLCQDARDVLKTWYVDFRWSEEQHAKGIKFAIRNCKRDPNFIKSNLEKQSCEAVEKIQSRSRKDAETERGSSNAIR